VTDTRPLTSLLGGRYRLGDVLGAGGMATVHRARDERLGRDVAVKLFRPDVADAQDLRRISSEIRMLAGLNHPSLVTLHDASTGEAGETAYLVLELIDGPTLAELLREQSVSPAELARLLAQVADALSYIGARGVVHRDVKPENVLVAHDADGGLRAKLADLGIARIADESRLTTAGSVIGTARYLSPEQINGTHVGPPTDIYALGLVLLESLTGSVPFPGTGTESAVARTLRRPALPGGLSDADAQLVARMTGVEPEDRPTAREVRDGLTAWSSPGPFRLPPAQRTPTAPTRVVPAHTVPGTGPTQVLPVADARPTRALTPPQQPTVSVARPVGPPAPPPRRSRHRRIAWSVLLVLLLAGSSIGVVAAWPAISAWVQPGPAEPPPAYPAVEGDLGTHLAQLEAGVEGDGLTDELTLQLRDDVLAVATAAAVTDYTSAVASLETMAEHVDAAAVADHISSARYRLVLTAIETVRGDIEDAVAAEQAELERIQQEQQQEQAQQSDGIFGGLHDRLDQFGRDLQRQIERWTGEAAAE
jgi:serine/threonine protein kinase